MPSGIAGVDVKEIGRPDGASNIADLGLTLSEAKQLLARVQRAIVAAQAGDLATRRPECPSCRSRCHVNGRRCHLLATPFGKVTVQLPQFRCVSCGHPANRNAQSMLRIFAARAGVCLSSVGTAASSGVMQLRPLVGANRWLVGTSVQSWNRECRYRQRNEPEAADRRHRIHAVMHHFKGEAGARKSITPSRKLWTSLHALDGYLTGQSDWLVNYAERHRARSRVGTAITEGTANFLVSRCKGLTAMALGAIAARLPTGLRQASPATCRASVARYGQSREKRRVRGEPAGYELGEEPHALRLACLALCEKPNRSVHVQVGTRHPHQ
jgi:hypothetical protein